VVGITLLQPAGCSDPADSDQAGTNTTNASGTGGTGTGTQTGAGAGNTGSSGGAGGSGASSTAATGSGGGTIIPPDVLFFDDFEYVADRHPASGDAFITEGGWDSFKDMRTSANAGGYLYTATSIPGFAGPFPGARSNRVLCIESRVGTEAPEVSEGWWQTDFYLRYGDEGTAVPGHVPPNLWVQFWMYQNDFGEQASRYNRSDKWIYPTRGNFPAGENDLSWLLILGTASWEPSNVELGSSPDRFIRVQGHLADFTAASEYPTNASKLGPNLDQNGFVARNAWRLVKIHLDTSGEQGVFEAWMRGVGGAWSKVSEWIPGVTPNFSWPIAAPDRVGHRMFAMPTTMNRAANSGGGDSWTYLDDFALATSEAALPQYP
jgi:hypothetical protein